MAGSSSARLLPWLQRLRGQDSNRRSGSSSASQRILASIGLVLPGLTRILPWLTPLAASGLMVVMVSATFVHISRGEWPSAISTVNLLMLVTLIAYLRWKVVPIESRTARG